MTNIDDQVIAYFTTMKNCLGGMNNAEYLNIAHEQLKTNKVIEKNQDIQINLSDFIPETRSLNQDLKLSPLIREKWGASVKKEILGHIDNDTFDTTERALPAGSCRKSVIFLHLVGFHSSRQNIY